MTSGRRIRIGQLGIGHNHGSGKMAALRKLTDHFEVVGVAESDPEWRRRRESDPAYKGLTWLTEEQLLSMEGLDAIAVETDVPNLIPAAQRCLEAGLHIHLDKPGGETMGPFRETLELADSKQLIVQMAYMYRYTPAIQLCLQAVKEGWLGRVFEVHAVMSRMDGMDYRKWLGQFRGGAMYIFGCHLIDLVVSMLGAPDRVTPYPRRTWHEKDDLFDNGLAVMEYPQATATIRTSVVEVEGFRRRQLAVCGDQGSFEIQPLEYNGPTPKETVVRLTLAAACGGYEAGCHEFEMATPKGRYDAQMIDFAEMIRGNAPNPYPTSHELIVQEATLAASGIEP